MLHLKSNPSPWHHLDENSRRSACKSQVQNYFQVCCLSKCQRIPAGR